MAERRPIEIDYRTEVDPATGGLSRQWVGRYFGSFGHVTAPSEGELRRKMEVTPETPVTYTTAAAVERTRLWRMARAG